MATTEYIKLADYILGELISHMPVIDQAIAKNVSYQVEYRAEPWHKLATGTPQDYTLLGMYEDGPQPKITIFEESIKHLQHMFGGLYAATKEALTHEIYQHAFGLDHTRETEAHGLIPAFAVKTDTGKELQQWLI